VFEMDRRGHGTVTRSTVYRVLVRNGLIEPKSRKRRRQDYKRWERPAPMQLWQLDVTASAFLADSRERLHQSLQIELLDPHGPFESLQALQAALDGWREECNANRPHQSLAMAFPISRFAMAAFAAGAGGADPRRPHASWPG
jgi:Integrase core domain